MSVERSCMTCKHQGMQYCPFHTGYTGWDDVYCSKWEAKESLESDSLRSTSGQPCDDSAIGRKSMSNGMGNPGTLSGVASCSFDADEEQGTSIKKNKEEIPP